MIHNQKLGDEGERLAAEFLESQGYLIREKKWRSGHSEIDLIAEKDEVLVFVEVKTRKSTAFGFPEESVSMAKQSHLARGAEFYLESCGWNGEIRFDIISIVKGKDKAIEIHHIRDAFFPKKK